MAISRVSSTWQNWPGAPGITQMFMTGTAPQATVDGIRAFWDAIKAFLPQGLTIQVQGSGDVIDEVSGNILSTWSATTQPAVVTGTGGASTTYAGNAGGVIHWLSNVVVRGRRVRGRTFVVPMVPTAYDLQGSLGATTITTMTTAGNALLTASAGTLVVWNRPVFAKPKTTPPTRVHDGSMATVLSCRVPDLAVSLRSRRI